MEIDKLKRVVNSSTGGPLYFYELFYKDSERLFSEFEASEWCLNSNGYYFNLTREAKEALDIETESMIQHLTD